jgi:hypothetical protein
MCSRWVYRACDAALTAGLEHGRLQVLRTRRSNYEYVQLVVALATRIFPVLVARARNRLYRLDNLPIAAREVELLNFGTACTVLRLRHTGPSGTGPPLVLKTFRKSIGKRLEPSLRHAARLRASYDAIAAWYSDCSVVVPTRFLILHGPVVGRSVVCCVQPYIQGGEHDFFELASKDGDLPQPLRENAALRDQFRRFAERTLEMADTDRRCIDLMGSNNLLLAMGTDGPHLQLIDFGMHDFALLAVKAPHRLSRVHERLLLLKRLHEQVLLESLVVAAPASGAENW